MTNGYARPEMLCETAWLQEHLEDPSIRIIDCGMPDAYNRAHIPGAVGLPHPYLKGPDGIHVMSAEQFEELMSARGVSNDHLVILYDDNASLYAARVFWVFDHFGHTNVKVLNGGFNKWLHEGRPITSLVPRPQRTVFKARETDTHLCRLDDLRGCVGDPNVVIWDVRTPEEYTGQNDRGNKRRGHVPGAVHLEWRQLMHGPPERTFKSAEEMRQLLEPLGVLSGKPVVTY